MLLAVFLDALQRRPRVEAVLVQIQRIEPRCLDDELTVVAHRGLDGGSDLVVGKAVRPRRDHDARGETLDVPLEGPGQRFVEVVEVEDQFPVGCAVPSEVAQMGIATELDPKIRAGTGRKIACHDGCSAAQKGEWSSTHPPVAKRHELSEPVLVLFPQNGERIGVAGFERGLDMGYQGNGFPPRPSGFVALDGGGPKVGRFAIGLEQGSGHAATRKSWVPGMSLQY